MRSPLAMTQLGVGRALMTWGFGLAALGDRFPRQDEVVEVDMPGHIESGLQSRHEAGEFQSPEERQAA